MPKDDKAAEYRAEAKRLRQMAELFERMADLADAGGEPPDSTALQVSTRSGNKEAVVTARTKVRISLRALSEAVGVTHSYLSQARRGKRRIRRDLAEKIAKIASDMPATRATWPKGWSEKN